MKPAGRLTAAPNAATHPALGQLDRRAFLVGASAVAVATGLTACGGLEDPCELPRLRVESVRGGKAGLRSQDQAGERNGREHRRGLSVEGR